MRLSAITANRHIFDGQVNGKPYQLLLNFDRAKALHLKVAADGEQMTADAGPLDVQFDMNEYGHTDVSDVTQSLFPTLQGLEIVVVEALTLCGRQIGVKLCFVGAPPFHFWADGDELHWGDTAAFLSHPWLDGLCPTASGYIEV